MIGKDFAVDTVVLCNVCVILQSNKDADTNARESTKKKEAKSVFRFLLSILVVLMTSSESN